MAVTTDAVKLIIPIDSSECDISGSLEILLFIVWDTNVKPGLIATQTHTGMSHDRNGGMSLSGGFVINATLDIHFRGVSTVNASL